MTNVSRQDAFEHLMQPLNIGIGMVARAAARLEQEERIGIQRGDIEIVRVLRRYFLHRLGIRAILFDPLRGVERLDISHRDRLDERPLLDRGTAGQGQRFARRGIRVWRLVGGHRRVQVRPPRPRLTPVADRAVSVALPCFAERPHRLRLGERVHHLEALVEERLGFHVARRHRPGKRTEAVLEDLDRLGVTLVDRPHRASFGQRRDPPRHSDHEQLTAMRTPRDWAGRNAINMGNLGDAAEAEKWPNKVREWSGRQDSNQRHLAPKASALPG